MSDRNEIPRWANKEKLKEGRAAEERACELFSRMFDGIQVHRYPWNSIMDCAIKSGKDIIGYIEVKSHKRGIGASSMNAPYGGLYKMKAKQYDFAVRVYRDEKKKTVFMVEFGGEWYYVPNLATVNIRNRFKEEWQNEIGDWINTEYVLFDHNAFQAFPTVSGGYLSNT